jgi:beta-phosphoglucomutase-like phosphatase (HAD superfamily)
MVGLFCASRNGCKFFLDEEHMIRAWIFDLDGTLVKTERLKALSYARAAVELCPHEISEADVIEAFKGVVGLSRREVAQSLVNRFQLEEKSRARMDEFGVNTPWQAFIQVRLKHYAIMISDPDVIRNNQWPHNVELLREARRQECKTALVTMSTCEQATRVLKIIDLLGEFDFVATRDDVNRGKPDPEIYHLALEELQVKAEQSLAIEDSPAGVQSALSAGLHVVAVATPFTRDALHSMDNLPASRIVDDPTQLHNILERIMQDQMKPNK